MSAAKSEITGTSHKKTKEAAQSAQKSRWLSEGAIVHLGRVALLIAVLVTWELTSGPVFSEFTISSPSAVARQTVAWVEDGTLAFHAWITLQETLLGLTIGIAVGVVFGFLIGPLRTLGRILDPFLLVLYSIPKVALAPLFLVWFGIGLSMKVILAAVIVSFLVFFNTVAGVRAVDQGLIDAVRLMGGTRRDIALKVVLPAATGWVLTGIRIAIPYALIGAVIGELIASNRGIGYLIVSSSSQLHTAGVFAALVVLALVAVLLNAVVELIERRTNRWQGGSSPDVVV
jgi:NitT/TauT family transport system permease protein